MRSYNSPYLLKLFEVHESANSVYFIIELVEGGELLDRVK